MAAVLRRGVTPTTTPPRLGADVERLSALPRVERAARAVDEALGDEEGVPSPSSTSRPRISRAHRAAEEERVEVRPLDARLVGAGARRGGANSAANETGRSRPIDGDGRRGGDGLVAFAGVRDRSRASAFSSARAPGRARRGSCRDRGARRWRRGRSRRRPRTGRIGRARRPPGRPPRDRRSAMRVAPKRSTQSSQASS